MELQHVTAKIYESQGAVGTISVRTILGPPAVAAYADANHPDIPWRHDRIERYQHQVKRTRQILPRSTLKLPH